MIDVSPQNQFPSWDRLMPPGVEPATNDAILSYLRHSGKIAELARLAEKEAIVLKACDMLELTVSDEELQMAGDAFRTEQGLLGAEKTYAWLKSQRISAEDWTQGIRMQLLNQKLKQHLFGDIIDSHYLEARENYRQAAFSQILVSELPEALKIIEKLRSKPVSFCATALEFSKAYPSANHGGFAGVRFISTLMPAIKEAVEIAQEGEIIGPIQTKLGYHILRIERFLESKLSEKLREEILSMLFDAWLENKHPTYGG